MNSAVTRGRAKLAGAFFLIYFVWGSNFLAIRYAVETVPPFLLMGVRSLLAGLCLYAWARLLSAERPSAEHWRAAAAVGLALFLGCHGLLAWAQQRVPSGVAALALAAIPLWMTLLDWLWAGAPHPVHGAGPHPRASWAQGCPDMRVWMGLGLGFSGLSVLVGPGRFSGRVEATGVLALLGSGFAWAAGSILARRSRLPASVVLSTGMQLVAGGLALILVSAVTGETAAFDPKGVSLHSLAAFAYMVGAASILAFTAYVWLLRVSTPSLVASYAFVNPLVAVVIGWLIGGEPLTARIGFAALLIVLGVGAIVTGRRT